MFAALQVEALPARPPLWTDSDVASRLLPYPKKASMPPCIASCALVEGPAIIKDSSAGIINIDRRKLAGSSALFVGDASTCALAHVLN